MTATDLNAATDRTFTARNFALEGGGTLPEMTLIFDTYGRLAADGANAILVTHGYTGSHRAAGPATAANPAGGWWKGLIGPGLAIDTNRYYVVSSNMLGSSYGSTGPSSVNPATGKPTARPSPRSRWATSSAPSGSCSTAWACGTWSQWPGSRSAGSRPSSGPSPTPTS